MALRDYIPSVRKLGDALRSKNNLEKKEAERGKRNQKLGVRDTNSLDKAIVTTRRQALGWLGASVLSAGAAMAVGASTCDSDKPSSPPARPKTEPVPEQQNPNPSKIEIEVDEEIPIPTFKFSKEKVPEKKPENINMSDEDFLTLSKEIAGKFKQELLKLDLNEDVNHNDAVSRKFLERAAIIVNNSSPEANKDMQEFAKTWKKNPGSLVTQLNRYLIPSGFYLHFDPKETKISQVNMYKIANDEEINSIQVSDSLGSAKIPVLNLTAGILKDREETTGYGTMATCDREGKRALIFSDRFSAGAKIKWEDLPPDLQRRTTFSEFKQHMLKRLMVHEATHAFFAKRFSTAHKKMDKNGETYVNLKIKLGKNRNIDLSKLYRIISLHELGALGSEMNNAEGPIPITNFQLVNKKGQKQSYNFAGELSSIGNIMFAPNSRLREKIAEKFINSGQIIFEEMAKLLKDPRFPTMSRSKIGAMMYRLAYKFMEKANQQPVRN